jgi:xylulose-5-phosphate/fructose-6-phosphate phosphoketolase
MEHCMASTGNVNVVLASKHPLPQWLSADEAREHVTKGASVWEWAGNDGGDPDVVLACCGTIPTIEILAAAWHLRQESPDTRVRVVNVTDLFTLAHPDSHPHGLSEAEFRELFTDDRSVIFSFHGYPSAIHQLLHRRPTQERFHVRGYAEEGTTTTPFDLLTMNGVSRYQLAIEALRRADVGLSEHVSGMSGSFAVRSLQDAEKAVEKFEKQLVAHRQYIREHGDDPPEIQGWSWS